MKRIFIAGPYAGDNELKVFENMRKGMTLATQVRRLGYAPFAPWMDFMYYFLDQENSFNIG